MEMERFVTSTFFRDTARLEIISFVNSINSLQEGRAAYKTAGTFSLLVSFVQLFADCAHVRQRQKPNLFYVTLLGSQLNLAHWRKIYSPCTLDPMCVRGSSNEFRHPNGI